MQRSESSQANNKSIYCDYNDTFTTYDQIRRPHGAQELLEIFSQSSVPIKKQIVLEGGFGTGAYLDIFRHEVEKIYGIEGSDQGLRQAELKTKDSENVHLQIGNILDLPFDEEFFDVYMVNQVIHHLDTGHPFENMDSFLDESLRVLKPQGILTINTCSQEQLDPENGSHWHYKYISSTANQIRKRYVPIEELQERLDNKHFTDIEQTIPSENIFHKEYYNNPEVALRTEFKNGDSIYSLLSKSEIEESDNLLKAAIANGSVYDEMKRAADRVIEIGETLTISAIKS